MPCRSIADVLAAFERRQIRTDIRDNAVCPEPVATAPRAARGYGECSVAQTNRNRQRNRERQRAKRALARLADAPAPSEVVEPVAEPLSPGCEPWLRPERIRASCARDVIERHDDDRSREWRRRQYEATLGAIKPASRPKFNFGAQKKAASLPKSRAKKERTPELREYFRNYGRAWRARKKAEAQATS